MRLFYSPTSPYARKVRLLILEKGLQDQIDMVVVLPMEDNRGVTPLNPLGKIPTLETADGQGLYDSPVICAYLDTLNQTPQLIPSGAERWSVLRQEALTDGLLDTALVLVKEYLRPEEMQSSQWLAHWHGTIQRTLDHLEQQQPAYQGTLTLAQLALGATLGYLDFRLPQLAWRQQRPQLQQWYTELAQRPSMLATCPPTS
ncbi:Glutathione S-transferase, N-terminal domain [Magnetococcus marinus MC-1]|uniref:Glutathione S-transferase, N-terminal domain n=1 Tax=Magnetococcus marinus (strain ATCC BAA-1437 / JCM 17883 / MC-1) TaxID=156889 RepID=A0LDX3_MAGMM|nr:glutathione S-transferase N-terminal domain-containing protein [Magnetococcus marinus]ABK46166.1 Glutathione S-transferase, N-terminal domain [Magnetococcus marinus MC-1]